MSLEFRLIEIEKRNPFTIAAMDQAILEACDAGRSPPTLVYHDWEPSVSIATNQTINDLNIRECQQRGFQVVRVRTGGKAVVHFPDTEFSYSLFVPTESYNVTRVYKEYCGRIGAALASFGLPATVVNNNDIFVNGKKIAGNAQFHKQRISMQHGLVLYEKPDARVIMALMNPTLYAPTAVDELDDILTSFITYNASSQALLRDRLTRYLTDGASCRKGKLTDEERTRMAELVPVYRRTVHDSTATGVRGLCWLPAPAYVAEKHGAMEARA